MRPPAIPGQPVRIAVMPTSCATFSAPYAASSRSIDLAGSWGSYAIADNLNRYGFAPSEGLLSIRSDFEQLQLTSDDRCDRTVERFARVDYTRPRHVKNQPYSPFERLSVEVTLKIEQFTHHLGVDNNAFDTGSGVAHLAAEAHVVLPDGGETLKRQIGARTVQARKDMADFANVIPGGSELRFTMVTAQAYSVQGPLPIDVGFWFTHTARANNLRMNSIVELRARLASIKVCSRRFVAVG